MDVTTREQPGDEFTEIVFVLNCSGAIGNSFTVDQVLFGVGDDDLAEGQPLSGLLLMVILGRRGCLYFLY